MYIEEFFSKYNGKAIDKDGAYGAQCMDLYNMFQEKVLNVKARGAQYARDVWTSYDKNVFNKIVNTPDFVPILGDVAVWTNNYGHVSICTGNGDKNSFESFDQNWDGVKYSRFVWHNYTNGFVGVLRPINRDFSMKDIYDVGRYKTLYVMNVRDGVWGRVKTKSELSKDGQKYSNSSGNYLAGTVFDALEIVNADDGSVWARGYSGYICIRDNTTIYCQKIS